MQNQNRNGYVPKPIDLSDVQVPQELMALSEQLALNTHEVWSAQRMSEGWQWGETMDQDAKTHPDLVPYDELPEGEKVYDRNTSMNAIRFILRMGYRIVKDEDE